MKDHTEKLAPVPLTKKQKKYLARKAFKTGVPITTIVRQLIDKDMEAVKTNGRTTHVKNGD